ncbi:MAG: GIY-YIG nuclease family protein [Candidatus Levyibacteriota bacterium]
MLYVGKAKNLKNRVSTYFTSKNLGEKTANLVSQVNKIKTIHVASEIESLLLEANLIKKYKPKYNLKLTDDKAYLQIKITTKDKYPSVLIVRRNIDDKALYFGPFPNSSAIRLVLKTTRRIFPYKSVKNHPAKICFYNHLGLCPCPEASQDKDYRKNIKHLIKFLNGKTNSVIKDLEKDREQKSNIEDYENAHKIQKQINAIKYITTPIIKPFEYELNPNLKSDIRTNELKELIKVLYRHNVKINRLKRIECFDISNISGKHTVGSMVAFRNGDKDLKEYKRFRIINTKGKQNDYLSMNEVIKRRFLHKGWGMPDLIVVDGGKPQISAALLALSEQNIDIPVIGLSKNEETIITSEFKKVAINKNSIALHLIMRIRDEAHRFAITYNKKLRSKSILS